MFGKSITRFAAIMAIILCSGVARAVPEPATSQIASPDGRLVVDFRVDEAGAPRYAIRLDGQLVLQESRLGLIRSDADFSHGLSFLSGSRVIPVRDRYEILTAKRRLNDYRANRKVFHLQTAAGQKMDIIFQVSDDGVAFRYLFPERSAETFRLTEEVTSFKLLQVRGRGCNRCRWPSLVGRR
jgi:hypothetical protein